MSAVIVGVATATQPGLETLGCDMHSMLCFVSIYVLRGWECTALEKPVTVEPWRTATIKTLVLLPPYSGNLYSRDILNGPSVSTNNRVSAVWLYINNTYNAQFLC